MIVIRESMLREQEGVVIVKHRKLSEVRGYTRRVESKDS